MACRLVMWNHLFNKHLLRSNSVPYTVLDTEFINIVCAFLELIEWVKLVQNSIRWNMKNIIREAQRMRSAQRTRKSHQEELHREDGT